MPPGSPDHARPGRDGQGHAATLPASPASAATARRLVRRLLPATASDEHCANVELLTSELVANAVLHARTACRLRLSYPREHVVRVEVTDRDNGTPTPQSAEPCADSGRGLHLVAELAIAWGIVRAVPAGKTVWFETAL